MDSYLKILSIIFIFVGSHFFLSAQNLQINELMSSNVNTIFDEDGDSPDWIELINTGETEINLTDYYLSDDFEDLQKWQLPDMNLSPHQCIIVFASDKDRRQTPVFWNNVIDLGDTWRYKIPSGEISAAWKTGNYDYSSWAVGKSGIGYEDNDDNTVVPYGTMSVFMITKFSFKNPEDISKMWFHMDYDDGFVAYLNGTEIAREGLGSPGSAVAWNQAASSHEALIYNGQQPEAFDISDFIYLLRQRENVLAVQVHNTGTGSTDMTSIPFLSVGSQIPFDEAETSSYITMPTLYPHTNFKLSSEGETVYLSTATSISDSVKYEVIPGGYSFGRDINDPEEWGYFIEPTPGELNNTTIYNGFVQGEIEISPKEMFVSSPVQLVLSGAAAGEEIRYTLDGSEPNENSALYTSPITLNDNTPVRAQLFIPGGVAGKSVSHTFIFDDPPTLPVVSILTNYENLWDNETGIYVLGDTYENQNPYYGANFWEDWEKPASVEMYNTEGDVEFSLNCGIKIFGAWSRAHPQKSLAVFFRKEYGDPVLKDIQLFNAKPITEFKSFVLRNAGNDYGGARFRDVFMTDLVRDMNTDIAASEPIVLYLNGEYWGHMNLREKINEDYLESNHGYDANEIDMLEGNGSIIEGSNEHYLALLSFLEQNNMSLNSNYETVSGMMDVENFIDYEISQIYFNNGDWPGNNIKFWKPQTEDGKWRWILYDTDFGFGLVNSYSYNTLDFATATNGPGWPNPPWSTLVLRKLLENSQFKNDFVNRFADMMNTTFNPNFVNEKIDSIAGIIEPEIDRNYQLWNTPSYSTWNQQVQTMISFAQYRLNYLKTYVREKFELPAKHEVSLAVTPYNSGNIKLNTITISKNNWQGDYFQDIPIKATANSYPGYKFKEWKINGVSMLEETIELNLTRATTITAVFEASEDDGKTIVINELNYHSPDENDAGDWVELYNWGSRAINISGWVIKDDDDIHAFVIPDNTVIESNAYFVFCRDSVDFSSIHPGVTNYAGELSFGFSSGGDAVRLFDDTGILIDEVYFGSNSPWATEPNGFGPTLELINPRYENNDPISWNSSIDLYGTPGSKNSILTDNKDIADRSEEKILKVYPNPFSDETKITWENNDFSPMEIRIFTLDGRLVYQNFVSNGELIWNGTSANNQRLKPGIYICNVHSEKRVYTEKLILTQ